MPYVASTLSSDNSYTGFHSEHSEGSKIARPAKATISVLIRGGANVAGKLHTPEGVVTKVSEAEANFLRSNRVFKMHLENGHVRIFESEVAPEIAAKDMTDRDESAPLNEAKGDFEDGGRAAGIAPIDAKVE